MKFLVDTHVLIWWWTEEERLSAIATRLLIDPTVTILVSAATAWEIATKHRLGRLSQLDTRFRDLRAEFTAELAIDRFVSLAVTLEHGLRAGSYDAKHRDPFDRLLAAQADLDGLTLVTKDEEFSAFPCETLW